MANLVKEKLINKYQNYGKGCLDIGKEKNYCYVESPGGKYLKVFPFTNNLEGLERCLKSLQSFQESEDLSGILMGAESTGSYGDAATSWLKRMGIEMVGVNPKHVSRMKELVGNSPLKSDYKDPKVGTLIIQAGRYHELLVPKGIAAELRELTKSRKQLKVTENRIANQLESHVVRVFPEFLQVMKSILRVTSLYLLEHHPLPEDILLLGKKKLLQILKEKSRYQLGNQRTLELYESAEKSIGIKEGLTSISLVIKGLVVQLRLIQSQIKDTEKLLESTLLDHPEADFLLSVPSIGVISASELIGETGGLNNYMNAHQLIKLAGFNLYEISSGNHKGKMKITKRGRGNLRQILYLAALRMIKKNGIFRKEYEEYIKRMKKPQAIVAIAKKLLRILHSLVKKQEMFDKDFSKK